MLTSHYFVPLLFPLIFLMFDLSSPSLIISKFNSVLSDILSVHAPVKTRTVPSTHTSPWFTPDHRILKSSVRQLEHLYRNTRLTLHHQAFLEHLKNYKSALHLVRSSFVSAMINKASNRPKALFNTINKLTKPPPNYTVGSDVLCCSFLNYLLDKMAAVPQGF